MKPYLTDEIIDKFIRLGEVHSDKDASSQGYLSEVSKHGEANRLHWSEWDRFTANLSTSKLISLIKGLTIAEKHYRWIGGSVAAVIWVYRQLRERGPKEAVEDITRWVFDNRLNPYIPLGTTRYSSYEDYLYQHSDEYHKFQNKKRIEYEKREKEQREAAARRSSKRMRNSIKHQKRAEEKAKQREKIIYELATKNAEHKWNYIASNSSVNIDYYPIEWTNEPKTVFQNLSSETRIALIERTRFKRRGPWKKLRNLLIQIEKEQS